MYDMLLCLLINTEYFIIIYTLTLILVENACCFKTSVDHYCCYS